MIKKVRNKYYFLMQVVNCNYGKRIASVIIIDINTHKRERENTIFIYIKSK
jgi:hypothetical protein